MGTAGGYTVELYSQPAGNLSTSRIAELLGDAAKED